MPYFSLALYLLINIHVIWKSGSNMKKILHGLNNFYRNGNDIKAQDITV